MRTLTRDEQMAVSLARHIDDDDVVATGDKTPVATMAALIARATHAPNATYLNVPGSKDGLARVSSMECTALIERGELDVFFFTPIQVDPRGDFNLQYVESNGERKRLYGAWSSPLYYQMVRKVLLFRTEHASRLLVPELAYKSATVRDDCPGGPATLVTSRAEFTFDKARRRFTLATTFNGESAAQVMDGIEFDHDVSDHLVTGLVPTDAEVDALDGPVRSLVAEVYPLYAAKVYA